MMDWLTHVTGEKTEGLLNQEERRWLICIETSRRIVIPIFSNGLTLQGKKRGEVRIPWERTEQKEGR